MSDNVMDKLTNPLGFENFEAGLTDEQREAFDKAAMQTLELAKAFERFIASADGKMIIQHLREMTIENSTWCASLGMEKGVPHGFAREGQNALVRYIEDMAKKAPFLKQQQPEKEKANG